MMFSALRAVTEEQLALGNTVARLRRSGYQPQIGGVSTSKRYLRFQAGFVDQSKLTGYIATISWLNHAVPSLAGIDWLSASDEIISQLVSAYPLQFELKQQHAAMTDCKIVELVNKPEGLASLPCLPSSLGDVFVEQFTCPEAGHLSSTEPQKNHSVTISFFLGHSALPLQCMTSIRAGDVLLIEHIDGQVSSPQKTLFKFEYIEESVMILEHDEEVQNELDYPVPTFAGDSTERDGFANLPIQLSVVLMEKNLPLAELQAITPGQTISVPRDAIMNVEIRANQRRFAYGELVQIANGQLAVEIHKVWP